MPELKMMPVDYSSEVTLEQVSQIEEIVRREFDDGTWVTVEAEE